MPLALGCVAERAERARRACARAGPSAPMGGGSHRRPPQHGTRPARRAAPPRMRGRAGPDHGQAASGAERGPGGEGQAVAVAAAAGLAGGLEPRPYSRRVVSLLLPSPRASAVRGGGCVCPWGCCGGP